MFCFAELNLSLDQIEDMTFAEFVLRQRGYWKRKKEELKNIRLISYNNFLSHWDNPKKKPPTIEQYWSLDNNKPGKANTDQMADKFKAAYMEYLKEKK